MTEQKLATRRAPAETAQRPGKVWNIVLWVLQIAVAAEFVLAGIAKVTGNPQMVDMFAEIGAGQWFRVVTGLLELAGAVGLLIPALSGLAGLGLAALSIGATITNVFVLHTDTTITVVLFVVAAVIAWGRRGRTADLVNRFKR
ncbi:DoxX family protein [Amycolatopsis sp. NPDC088138]|uniref:DoxX family protein n=1 Tax=Amycolatopsis sp. NPDC088138 TaxID=3363938 RepID=UPI00380C0077